ncbi:hypothetical protein [Stenotrophomonas sp.]|uniref:hypothetical protein n=1 Tax=Stenotrophomonas sp. TaxID=69392 RepID=UPI002FC65D42
MSGAGLPPLWSPAQQSWLQAMGYTVFVDGQVEEAPSAPIALSVASAAPDAAPSPARTPVAEPLAPAAPPRRSAPARLEDDAPAVAPAAPSVPRERPAGGRRPAVRMPDRLQIALLRASGCNPADADTQTLMASWDLDTLRGNAAAKRALWPQLRALRTRGRG